MLWYIGIVFVLLVIGAFSPIAEFCIMRLGELVLGFGLAFVFIMVTFPFGMPLVAFFPAWFAGWLVTFGFLKLIS